MKCKTIFGALLVSVALCSQGFSFELLDRVLGLNCGGCGECNACAKVAACEKACPQPCAPACEKACPKPCEPACEQASCGSCKRQHCTPVRDLFDNLKDLFEAKSSYCETGACETAKGCCPEPATCEKACPQPCEKVACEKPCLLKKLGHKAKGCNACCPVAACEPACAPTCEKACAPKCHKLYRRPVLELLEELFACDKNKCGNGCETGCEVGCATGCGGSAPAAAPAKAPEKAAPLPAAPKADPSAKTVPSRGIYQASRSLARN